ncbi:MAG: hypothetical protein H6618_03910 [Deltaproteobacteria bacterium]|nr:hypothetical protein [Deltaproteobacteria bacterium]
MFHADSLNCGECSAKQPSGFHTGTEVKFMKVSGIIGRLILTASLLSTQPLAFAAKSAKADVTEEVTAVAAEEILPSAEQDQGSREGWKDWGRRQVREVTIKKAVAAVGVVLAVVGVYYVASKTEFGANAKENAKEKASSLYNGLYSKLFKRIKDAKEDDVPATAS